MKQKKQILGALCGALITIACNNPSSGSSIESDEHSLFVNFGALQVAGSAVQVDSAVFDLRASGMTTFHIAKTLGNDSTLSLEHIPAGANKSIELSLYNTKGQLLFRGDSLMNLSGGELTNLKIRMKQQFGSLRASVPLPLSGNSVQSGSITLIKGIDTLRAPLSGKSGAKEFKLSPIPYSDGYAMLVRLWNGNGDTLYSYNGNIDVKAGSNQNLNIKLNSIYSSLALSLELSTQTTENIDFEISGSKLRSPTSMGELIFSEIMPNPGVSADSVEWLELYNASSDTLDLRSCAIRKSRSSTSATTSFWIDSTQISKIAPNKTLVLGREKVSFANGNYHSFTMTNSGQDLLILCKNILIDSLSYSDSKFPYASSVSMQLDLDHFSSRLDSASWCAGTTSNSVAGLNLLGSPGQTPSCSP